MHNVYQKIMTLFLFVVVLFMMAFSPAMVHTAQASPGVEAYKPVKKIVIDLSEQKLRVYYGKKLLFTTLVITGRPGLETPVGTYRIFQKLRTTTFYSPWPASSPHWYPPTDVQYAMAFREGGFYIHDSWWHTEYGPGKDKWHYDSVYGWQYGSHGCVSLPTNAAGRLYQWANIGTLVIVRP